METPSAVDVPSVDEILRAFGDICDELSEVLAQLRDLTEDGINKGDTWRAVTAHTYAQWALWLLDQADSVCAGHEPEAAPEWVRKEKAVVARALLLRAAARRSQ